MEMQALYAKPAKVSINKPLAGGGNTFNSTKGVNVTKERHFRNARVRKSVKDILQRQSGKVKRVQTRSLKPKRK